MLELRGQGGCGAVVLAGRWSVWPSQREAPDDGTFCLQSVPWQDLPAVLSSKTPAHPAWE